MMTKNTFVIGFLLFAIFFGAGNLIFPPKLGFESGSEFLPAILGFVLTGVGLPLLGIIVSAFYTGGYRTALNKIHPWFSLAFLISIYLAIGPFFAMPRTAATAYEMALVPFLGSADSLSLFLFTTGYFIISLWLTLNPSKMVDRIGAILTPILLLSIAALVSRAVFILAGNEPLVIDATEQSYFFKGVLDGYFTMDALASIAFSVIVLNAIKSKGVAQNELKRQTILAGVISAIALGLVYVSIGWIGNKIALSAETTQMIVEQKLDLGTFILNTVTTQAFGELGRSVLGVIVSLACLTTAVGLTVSVSEYFNEIYPKISYKTYVVIFTLISLIIANQGLKEVISKSVPVLLVLYPISMTIILMLLLNIVIKLPLTAQRLSLFFVTIVAIGAVAGLPIIDSLPLKSYSMEWLLPAIIGGVMGAVIHPLVSKK